MTTLPRHRTPGERRAQQSAQAATACPNCYRPHVAPSGTWCRTCRNELAA